jgi:hypothetical protein
MAGWRSRSVRGRRGATGVRVLTFGSGSMTVTVDTLVDGTALQAQRVTGYYSGSKRNVFYVPAGTGASWNRSTLGWCDPTGFTVYRSVMIHGKCFSMQGKRYMMVAYNGDTAVSKQNSVFLLEMVTDTTNATPGDISVAAVLAAGDASGIASLQRPVAGVAAVSSTKAVLVFSSAAEIAIPGSTASMSQEALARATLDWTGTLTGRPVKHDGLLYLPQATAKVYDGHAVLEIGPHLYPEAPTLTAGAGGSLTASTTYKYTALYFRYDATGKLIQSAPSFAATLTLAAGETKITVDVPTLRITEADAAYNLNPLVTPWRIALYRTAANGSDFRLVSVLSNSLTVDTVQLVDTAADTTIAVNPEPYTSTGEVDNVIPAAVLAFESHRDRLFAMASDTVYPSKETSGGVATSFAADTDGFFLEFDTAADGPLISQVSDGTSLFIASRHRVYPLQGDGPNLSATPETAYQFPSPLPAENGALGARSYVGTPDGILTGTSKGKHLLDRAGGMQPIPGADAYDSLTVTGGVTLDDRPMALLTTLEGRTICWDWQLKTWHTWTGQPAVSCCRWQNKFVWMESNGKVHVETPGLFADDAGAYTWVVQLSWVDMVHAYLKRIEVIGEAFGTCTLTALGSYDYDEANVDTSRSWALAVSGPKAPWILEPDQGYCEAYNLKLTETSTTQGVKLAKLLMWVGLLPGSHKHAPAQYAT